MDAFQALLCDEVTYVVEEASVRFGPTFHLTGAAQKEACLALVTGSMPQYLTSLQKQLQAHGGQYFADKRLTVADLNAFVDVRALNSVWLDHVPAELVQTVAPLQKEHLQRIAQDPAALAYCAKFAASQRGTGFTTVNLVPIGPVTVKADLLAC